MPDPMYFVAIVGGLVLLALTGDALVNGAVSIGRRLGVSPLLAGIVIVGFGTSLPEMIVAVNAALAGKSGLAFGNIVGSNVANLWLVLGLPALIAPVLLQGFGLRRVLAFVAVATAAWMLIGAFHVFDPWVGFAFLVFLLGYLVFAVQSTQREIRSGRSLDEIVDLPDSLPLLRAVIFVTIGIVGLPIGATLLVDGAVGIATFYNVSDRLIGLTLIAVGTSLPEIAAGVAAALRKQGAVVIGNVMGSNLFNILVAGGIVSLFGPFSLSSGFLDYDHWFMAASLLVIGVGILLRARIGVLGGLLLILLYALYVGGLVNNWNISALVGLSASPAPL